MTTYNLHGQADRSKEATADYQIKPAIGLNKAPRCRVDLVGSSGVHATSEVTCLLRRRLTIATAITLAGSTAFFLFNLFDPKIADLHSTFDVVLHGVVVAINGMLLTMLLMARAYPISWLRAIELALFGSVGLFFGWLQFAAFHNGKILEIAQQDHETIVVRLGAMAHAARWFCLIVIYGTFIPNTWKRCTVAVSIMFLAPLVVSIAGALICPIFRSFLPEILITQPILLAMGAAIAIFGSYKVNELQQEAFAARKMGHYVLKKRLGAGGMGEVYLAEHTLLRRPCAIKLIRPEHAGDPHNLARFEREVQATATLTHWNTVEIFDYGNTDDGTFYYVMEYLPGLSLQELVDRFGPLSAERTMHLLRQVAQALREAHAIGLIHRDIKPSNILACERGGIYDVAKLLDFGIVQKLGLGKDATRLTFDGAIAGSPPFMSPEQAAGKSKLDGRSDIYSLGAVAYYLMTGQPPFVRETAMEMIMSHVYEPVIPPKDIRGDLPDDIQKVILRCLEKDPKRRFADANDLLNALSQCQAAGHWSEEQAANWWQERGLKQPVQKELELVG